MKRESSWPIHAVIGIICFNPANPYPYVGPASEVESR